MLGLQFGQLLGGAGVIELVFGRPGPREAPDRRDPLARLPALPGADLGAAGRCDRGQPARPTSSTASWTRECAMTSPTNPARTGAAAPRPRLPPTCWPRPRPVGPRAGAPRTFWRDTFGSLKRQKGAMVGLVLIALVLVAALIGLVAVPESANRSNIGQRLQPPERRSPRSAPTAPAATCFRGCCSARRSRWRSAWWRSGSAACSGALQGLVAGFRGGLLGAAIMRFTDAMLAFPALLLALAVMATLGRRPDQHHDRRRPLLDAALHPDHAGRGAVDPDARLRPGGRGARGEHAAHPAPAHPPQRALLDAGAEPRSRSRRRSWPRRR